MDGAAFLFNRDQVAAPQPYVLEAIEEQVTLETCLTRFNRDGLVQLLECQRTSNGVGPTKYSRRDTGFAALADTV